MSYVDPPKISTRVLRCKEVKIRTGLSTSTIYRLMAETKFPQSIKLGARSVGWIQEEIEDWIESRIENRK